MLVHSIGSLRSTASFGRLHSFAFETVSVLVWPTVTLLVLSRKIIEHYFLLSTLLSWWKSLEWRTRICACMQCLSSRWSVAWRPRLCADTNMWNSTSQLPTAPDLTVTEAVPIDVDLNYPHKISDLGYTFVAVLLSIVCVLGTTFNVYSLVVFASSRKLRSPTNVFIMSLNVCDLCMSCFGTFMPMTSSWSKKWIYGHTGCVLEGKLVRKYICVFVCVWVCVGRGGWRALLHGSQCQWFHRSFSSTSTFWTAGCIVAHLLGSGRFVARPAARTECPQRWQAAVRMIEGSNSCHWEKGILSLQLTPIWGQSVSH